MTLLADSRLPSPWIEAIGAAASGATLKTEDRRPKTENRKPQC
jgi:hypothetical protein